MPSSWPSHIIAVVGPTASGKTDLAKAIAEKFGGFLISADARQMYTGMDIGTNKESVDIEYKMRTVKGYGLDLVAPNEPYTAKQFQTYTYNLLQHPPEKDLVPILVGGTGLWVKAIIDGLELPEVAPDEQLRESLEIRLKKEGIDVLASELIQKDPNLKGDIDEKNPRRVIRALEIMEKTGKPLSKQRGANPPPFKVLILMPDASLEELETRISRRIDEMFEEGFIEEVKKLREMYPDDTKAFSAIGYAEAISYLKDEIDERTLKERFRTRTRQYAKRQLTWWQKDSRVQRVKDKEDAIQRISDFLQDAGIETIDRVQ